MPAPTTGARFHRGLHVCQALAQFALLPGCSITGGGKHVNKTMYAPDPRAAPEADWPTVHGQMSLRPVHAASSIASMRIAVRPLAGEVQVNKGACWARAVPLMFEHALPGTLWKSGRVGAVATPGTA